MKAPRITLASIWLALPVMLTLLAVWTSSEFPLDFWLHVNSGRSMCETGQLIAADTFTHTINGQPVLNQPWLTQLGMYALFQVGGYPLIQFLTGIGYASAVGLITLLTYRQSGNARVASAVMVLTVAVAATNLAVRPQAISFLLFAVELYVLWRWAPHWSAWLTVAAIELVWTNTHGAFPLGVVLPGIFLCAAAGEVIVGSGNRTVLRDAAVRCYLACCLAAAISMFVNPQGLQAMQYVTGVTSKATARHIEEWLPTSLGTDSGYAFLASIAVAVTVLGLSRRALRLRDWLLLVAFLLLGAKSQRMVIWWSLVFPPVLAPHLACIVARWRVAWHATRRRARHVSSTGREAASHGNWLLAGALVAVLLVSTPWTRHLNVLLSPEKRVARSLDEPYGATRFLAESDFRGRIYQPMEWGSYVSWRLDPRVKVFVDSRVDFFPDPVWRDYVAAGQRPDQTLQILEKYDVNLVLWDHRLASGLPQVLTAAPSWQQVYRDQNSVIFVHERASSSAPGQLAVQTP